ncbi:hypothetical protein BJ170DRAFT_186736 [Xylariales sp. AK1849]|nr:hypothetical protein BJ170DRAFT_186736 [Xylariales sp. AK1849]
MRFSATSVYTALVLLSHEAAAANVKRFHPQPGQVVNTTAIAASTTEAPASMTPFIPQASGTEDESLPEETDVPVPTALPALNATAPEGIFNPANGTALPGHPRANETAGALPTQPILGTNPAFGASSTAPISAPFANATGVAVAPFTNDTGVAGVTTLTIGITSIATVISCAPTITDCPAASNTAALSSALATLPADAISTVLVTSVIDVTTTVCPITEAQGISSSIIDSIISSSAIVTHTNEVGSVVTLTVTASKGAATGVPIVTGTVSDAVTSSNDAVTASATSTVASVTPIETVVTVTIGTQVLTSSVTVAVPNEPAPTPIVSVVTLTVGGGSTTSLLTNTVTISAPASASRYPQAPGLFTLTLPISGGDFVTMTMTASDAAVTRSASAAPSASTIYVTAPAPKASTVIVTHSAPAVSTVVVTQSAADVPTVTVGAGATVTVTASAGSEVGPGAEPGVSTSTVTITAGADATVTAGDAATVTSVSVSTVLSCPASGATAAAKRAWF